MYGCVIDGCDRPVENRDTGLCATHNRAARKLEHKALKPSGINSRLINQVSKQQQTLLREYAKTCKVIDRDRPMICESCGRPQGGEIQLSHSHLISRDYCVKYNRLDLYVDPNNIKLQCKDWGGHIGCHTKWESNRLRPLMPDYEPNMAYIKMEIPEVYKIMKLNEESKK